MSLIRADLEFLRGLLERTTGIACGEDQDYLFDTRLAQVGPGGLPDLVARLRDGDAAVLDDFVGALTTSETYFFRDPATYEALREEILPELMGRRRDLTIWSAGCSTGQEPYSLAMLIGSAFPELRDGRLRMVATDISVPALGKARAGLYSHSEVNRGLPVRKLLRYFRPHGRDWELDAELRASVRFETHNLLQASAPVEPVDILLCRHVLIYFAPERKREILRRLRQCMHPQGYLIVGGAERLFAVTDEFRPVSYGPIVYYRPG